MVFGRLLADNSTTSRPSQPPKLGRFYHTWLDGPLWSEKYRRDQAVHSIVPRSLLLLFKSPIRTWSGRSVEFKPYPYVYIQDSQKTVVLDDMVNLHCDAHWPRPHQFKPKVINSMPHIFESSPLAYK